MRFFVYFMTPMLASLVTVTLKLQCQAFDNTIISSDMDDPKGDFSPEKNTFCDEYSSSVVKLQNQPPNYVEQELLRLDSKIVKELHLNGDELKSLPDSVMILSKVESINLMNNGISSIDSIMAVNLLPRLRSLVLSHNPLKSLKGLEARKLENLEAGFCRIQDIDGILPDSMPMLKKLNLTGNPLGKINKLTSDTLTDLILKNCSLHYLNDESFLGLSNLTHLDLEENSLNTIPDKIFEGKYNLRYLNLGRNRIKNVKSTWFSEMPKLENLYLNQNEITLIDKFDFTALSALTKLDLAENKLTTFPNLETVAIEVNFSRNSIGNKRVWDLSKMAKLQRLDLSHNRFEGNCDYFRSTSLGILILGYNKLTRLKQACISDLPNLTDINLKGNRISKGVSPRIFQNNQNLINLELDDNPWSCNCTDLFPLYYYITTGQRTQTTHLICHSPKNASGHTWWEFCNRHWRGLLIAENHIERGSMWIIFMSGGFGACVIFGTMVYITYTLKKTHPVQARDNTI